jgi:hypothetical protein
MGLRKLAPLAALLVLASWPGSASAQIGFGFRNYSLVEPKEVSVARGSMVVRPTVPWNKIRRDSDDIAREENWTLNGPLLDGVSFIGALENDKKIVQQRRKADRKVPNFRADMSPPEIAAMIESFYRIRAGAVTFTMTNLSPRQFLGYPGFQFDYSYLGGDEVERQGRAVGAIINNRFYLALFDAARMHYYSAGLPEFERIVTSARLKAG